MRKLNNEISSKINRSLILTLIHQNPMISRAQLSVKTGLDRSTITHILNYLLKEGLVEEIEKGKAGSKGGRCPILLRVKYNAKNLLAIEIGYDSILGIISNLNGDVKFKKTEHIKRGTPLLELLNNFINNICNEARREFNSCYVISISAPGIVNAHSGSMELCVFHNWKNIDVVKPLTRKFGKYIIIENDANTAALGEIKNMESEGKRSLIYLLIREAPPESKYLIGIGSAIILNGTLWHGSTYSAGEIAETVNSLFQKNKILSFMEGNKTTKHTLSGLIESVMRNDSLAIAAMNDINANLGKYLGELVAFLDPGCVIVYTATHSDYDMAEMIKENFYKYLPNSVKSIDFRKSVLREKSIIEGLIALSQSKIFIQDGVSSSILFDDVK